MKCIKTDLGSDLKEIHVYPIADLHIGSAACKIKEIKEYIKMIAEDPIGYAVVLGDLCNTATKASVSDVYDELMTPMEEMETAVEILEPIKDRILLMIEGNHERRINKAEGVCITKVIARQLGIVDKFDASSAVLFLRFGASESQKAGSSHKAGSPILYTFYASHGSGGGSTIGGKANSLSKKGKVAPDTDIVICGHTHQSLVFNEAYYKLDERNNSVKLKEKTYCSCRSFLGYEKYADDFGFAPSTEFNPMIVLSGTKKKVKVEYA